MPLSAKLNGDWWSGWNSSFQYSASNWQGKQKQILWILPLGRLLGGHMWALISRARWDIQLQNQDPSTFAKNARFQVPKNCTLNARNYKRSQKTSRNTPQNGWVDIWVMHFHFRASIKSILKNRIFSIVLGPFHHLYEAKISNCSLSVVYGSITLNFFGGSGN